MSETEELKERTSSAGIPVCGCANLTRSDIVKFFERDGLSFDELINQTGAGTVCTACMLDLEMIASEVSVPRKNSRAEIVQRTKSEIGRSTKPHWRFIDRFSPLGSFRLGGILPVLLRDDISQHLVIANQPMFYTHDTHQAPQLRCSLDVRNGEGTVISHSSFYVAQGEEMWQTLTDNINKLLQTSEDQIPAVGSLHYQVLFSKVGMRGSTRANTVIESRGGTCGVHVQGPGNSGQPSILSIVPRAWEERFFVSVINPGNRELSGRIFLQDRDGAILSEKSVAVPPMGTRLSEVDISSGSNKTSANIVCKFNGMRRLHFLNSDSDLSVFGIDHF